MLDFRKGLENDRIFVYNLTKKNMYNYFNKFLPEGWSDEKFWEGFNIERILILEEESKQIGFFGFRI